MARERERVSVCKYESNMCVCVLDYTPSLDTKDREKEKRVERDVKKESWQERERERVSVCIYESHMCVCALDNTPSLSPDP